MTKQEITSRQKKCRTAALKRWKDPVFRAKMHKITGSKAYREKMSVSVSATFSDPVKRARRSAKSKMLWRTKDYREKVTAAIQVATSQPDYHGMRSRVMKRSWDEGGDRRRLSQSRMMKNEWDKNRTRRAQANRRFRAKIADRSVMTKSEMKFYSIIKDLGFGLEFTGARKKVAANRTPDFVSESKKLAIEIYGSQHLNSIDEDRKRMNEITSAGWKVLVIWSHELENEKRVIRGVRTLFERYG